MIFGFLSEFCAAGGEVTDRFWVPIGQKDYASIIAALPDDIDAIWVGLGGGDAVNFLNQYQQAGGETPFIAGSITVDQTILSQKGLAKRFQFRMDVEEDARRNLFPGSYHHGTDVQPNRG